ncbi:pyruvate dehydrogenase [acetyl-transferring]-phosphatase 1, mitochondrial isoform X2 [Cylas formicarius]|uniref:pyruvate dehydrogenase [acetyl-transferring]-phosphatase 1, mitochondrial isoform X2 n=1 Tax=Cylas formicarius TaxID=197179 RepID=UPI0029588BE6|nr:pyruvate dehydrogenase [acetyl-transferring]-phosphatase 1, mitochondrial isoform X2 [Cylas formicarius]
MVIACRSLELMKTGKNANVLPKGRAFAYRNYANLAKSSQCGALELVRLCCGCRKLHFSKETNSSPTKLTPSEVDVILRANEYTHEFAQGPVKAYETNQLPSNNPIEDTRSEATCVLAEGFLAGVFDGHGGSACAQVIAKRLFRYISACLLPHERLKRYALSLSDPKPPDLIRAYNDKVKFVADVKDIYRTSFEQFVADLAKEDEGKGRPETGTALERAFLRLDSDMSREALPRGDKLNLKTLSVAMSGAVCSVAHVEGPHLHVASVGDCCAVLGSLSDSNSWLATKLSEEHNSYNQAELDRIYAEHPENERGSVIKMDRLLGQLAPLRAMGDFRFKWSRDIMENVIARHFGEHMVPQNYLTPPYLTASPDVAYHRLTPRDRFLILATDGLWDILTPLQAVKLVGDHMKSEVTLHQLKLRRQKIL